MEDTRADLEIRQLKLDVNELKEENTGLYLKIECLKKLVKAQAEVIAEIIQ